MVRLTVVGCGRHSRAEHGACLARYAARHPGELQLVGACDLHLERAEAYAGEFGFNGAYDDLGRMLDELRPDGCLCIMPIAKIATVAQDLLRRGVPCVIEKPLGSSIVEARALAEVAQSTGTPHMVSVNRRYWPHLQRAVEWATLLGPVRCVRASMIRVKRAEANYLWSTGVHLIDSLRHAVGELATLDVHRPGGAELTGTWCAATMGFGESGLMQVSIATTSGEQTETIELIGEGYTARAAIDVVTGGSCLRCWHLGKLVVSDDSPEDVPRAMTNGSYHENVAFIKALQGERSMGPSVSDVLPSLELCVELERLYTLAQTASH